MIRRIEHLGRFKNHLHYMLIAVPSRATTRFATQKEDVHSAGVPGLQRMAHLNFSYGLAKQGPLLYIPYLRWIHLEAVKGRLGELV